MLQSVTGTYTEIRRSMFSFHSRSMLSSEATFVVSADCLADGSGHSMLTASGPQDDLTTSCTITVNDYKHT